MAENKIEPTARITLFICVICGKPASGVYYTVIMYIYI